MVKPAKKLEPEEVEKTRVFIVDDHPVLRKGLAQLLSQEEDLEVCGEAKSADDAVEKIPPAAPNVVIVDLSLEGFDGLDLIKTLKTRMPKLQMLVLSMFDEGIYAERSLRAGARGYVMKQEASDTIVNAIRKIRKGEIHVSPKMASRFLTNVAEGKKPEHRSMVDDLTDRELEVFTFLGKGMSTRQVAERLCLSIKTVETYREHIKNKLNLKTANELVRHAVRWVETGQN